MCERMSLARPQLRPVTARRASRAMLPPVTQPRWIPITRPPAQRPIEALHYFQRACEAGYAPSCNGLGVLYAEGRGTARDPVRAAQLYRMACEGGASTGCEHFAQALKQGRGVIQDEAAAERASARAKCVFQASLASRDLASCPGL